MALRAAQTTSSTARGVGLKSKGTNLGREGWKISAGAIPHRSYQPSAALLPSHPLEDLPSSQECQGEGMADCWHSLGIASAVYNALWQGQPGWGLINPRISFPNTAFSDTIMCINSSGVAKVCCKSNLFGPPLLKGDISVTMRDRAVPEQLPDRNSALHS